MLITPANDDATIPRSKMPQIDEKDLLALLVFLGTKGVSFSAGYLEPSKCRAHQAIDFDLAKQMGAEVLAKPCLISADLSILDGDHRWYRHTVDKTQMPFIKIELEFEEALQFLYSFPKTYELGDGAFHPISN